MALVQRNDMIEQVPAATSHPPLGNPVLPGTLARGASWLAAHGSDRRHHFGVELGIAIKDQIVRSGLVRECLAQLLYHPDAARVAGDVAVQNTSAVVGDDKEAVQDPEGEGGNGEEIHGCDHLAMVPQEGQPALGRFRASGSSPYPARDGSLGHFEAEHLQFSVNAGSAPGRKSYESIERAKASPRSCASVLTISDQVESRTTYVSRAIGSRLVDQQEVVQKPRSGRSRSAVLAGVTDLQSGFPE